MDRALWFVVLLCGCGGAAVADETMGPPQPDATPPAGDASASDGQQDALSRQVAETYCVRLFRCFPILASGTYSDVTACTRQYQATVEAMLTAPGVGYDGAEWLACELALSDLSCDALELHLYFGAAAPPACELPGGTLANSLPCRFDEQCQSGRCALASPCGICMAGAGEGELCDEITPCAVGFTCRAQGAEWRCLRRAGPGESCSDGAVCNMAVTCEGGTCQTPALGKEDALCKAGMCSVQYYCDDSSGTCRPIDISAGLGDACNMQLPPSGVYCVGGGYCDNGICVPPLDWGSPCEDVIPCLYPAVCLSGVCRLPSAEQCL